MRASNWYRAGIPLIYSDRAEYDRRRANPPWYVRYTSRLLRRWENEK